MAVYTIPYKPRLWQREVHNSRGKRSVIVCHRRAGKTNLAINELIKCAFLEKGARYAYIAPTYKQAKIIAWDILKQYLRPIPGVVFNESELRADLPNGSRVTLYGSDNPDSLRGIALWGVVFDEYSQQKENIFSEIVRPALADHQGWAMWIGTPKGQNNFYELFSYAKAKGWYWKLLKASESELIQDEELEQAKQEMSRDEYEQEFECSFTASIKGAIYGDEISEMYEEGRCLPSIYEKTLPVYTFWDLGVSDYTSIIFAQIHGGEVRLVDFVQDNGRAFDYYAKIVHDKKYRYAGHYLPHDSQARSLQTGSTLIELARKTLGDNVSVTPNVGIQHGLNSARQMFSNCWFEDSNTEKLRNCLSNYRKEWDDHKGMFKDEPLHDWASHASDAFRYLAVVYNRLTDRTKTTVTTQDYGDLL
jgi:hypothetical protein